MNPRGEEEREETRIIFGDLLNKMFGLWRKRNGKGEIIWRKKIFGLRRRRKTEKEKGGNNLRRDLFGSQRRRVTEKEKEKNIWRRKK